jgi:hypothetical protein
VLGWRFRLEAAVLAQLADLYRDGRVIERALAEAVEHVESERPRIEESNSPQRAARSRGWRRSWSATSKP